jgi:hypothetical protein
VIGSGRHQRRSLAVAASGSAALRQEIGRKRVRLDFAFYLSNLQVFAYPFSLLYPLLAWKHCCPIGDAACDNVSSAARRPLSPCVAGNGSLHERTEGDGIL